MNKTTNHNASTIGSVWIEINIKDLYTLIEQSPFTTVVKDYFPNPLAAPTIATSIFFAFTLFKANRQNNIMLFCHYLYTCCIDTYTYYQEFIIASYIATIYYELLLLCFSLMKWYNYLVKGQRRLVTRNHPSRDLKEIPRSKKVSVC